jgi:mannose-6-phosphate isomerase-like protein (cupin superfamily)
MPKRIWIGLALSTIMVATVAYGQESRSNERTEPSRAAQASEVPARPYTGDLFGATEANTDYRRVFFTGARSQLVAMSIPPGESIGVEKHARVEQTIVILSGTGHVVLDGKRTDIGGGDVVVVTPGVEHNLVNTGAAPLKLFTTYVPPNHIDGRVHRTKGDAERDIEDERYGEQVR